MKSGLFFLPILALLVGAMGSAIASAMPQAAMAGPFGWLIAAAIVGTWVVLDFEGFKSFFLRKGTKYGTSSGLVVLLGLAVIIGIALLSSRPRFNKTFDVTRSGANSLSDQSQKLVAKINDAESPITIMAFFVDDQQKQTFRDLISMFEAEAARLGQGFNADISYLDSRVEHIKVQEEELTSANTVVIKFGDRSKKITTFTEEKLANAFVQVLKGTTRKVYFTVGHGEGDLEGAEGNGFRQVKELLEENKIEAQPLSLLSEVKVPDDADAVIIAGPRYDFKAEEARALEEYLKKGGSLLSLIDAVVPIPNLGATLQKFGIRYNNDLLLMTDMRAGLLGQTAAVVSDFDAFHPVTADFSKQSAVGIILHNTRTLEGVEDNVHKLKVTLAGKTDEFMARLDNVTSKSDLQGRSVDPETVDAYPVLAVASGRTPSPETANNNHGQNADAKQDVLNASDSNRAKETRIVAVGSAQFANNVGSREPSHQDMFMNMVSYLTADEDFISIRPKDVTKSSLDLSSTQSQLMLLVLAFIYPFVFLGGGTLHWLKRRRA